MSTSAELSRDALLNVVASRGQDVCVAYVNGERTGAPVRPNTVTPDGDALYCDECGALLTETRFKGGPNWTPSQLAVFGRRKHSRILCMTHYREANQARGRAEEALEQLPF